jgi:bleomycin hydrolase
MGKIQSSARLRNLIFVFAMLIATGSAYSFPFDPVPKDYEWEIERTEVKNQGNTGTCWVFSGISFLESECIRKNTANEELDLSEAYVVYYGFLEKARYYLETMGEGIFTEYGWSNYVFYIIGKYGIVREDDYNITESFKAELSKMPWFLENDTLFSIHRLPFDAIVSLANQHRINPSIFQQMYTKRLVNRLQRELDATVTTYQDEGVIPEQAMIATLEKIKTILNEEIGPVPEEISSNGNMVTPIYFCQNILDIHSDDYVHITSFENLGFNEIVQLPPVWFVNGQYINVDSEVFYEIARLALVSNYGLVIECKALRESGYYPIAGKADLILYPDDMDYDKIESVRVHRYLMGAMSMNNHLMHMVGFDETRAPWFLIKNSYGVKSGAIPLGTKEYRGYINMSQIYFLLQTYYVTVHKDVLEYFPDIVQ